MLMPTISYWAPAAWNQAVAETGGSHAIAEQPFGKGSAGTPPGFQSASITRSSEHAIQVYPEWLAQRSRRFFQALPQDRSSCGLWTVGSFDIDRFVNDTGDVSSGAAFSAFSN